MQEMMIIFVDCPRGHDETLFFGEATKPSHQLTVGSVIQAKAPGEYVRVYDHEILSILEGCNDAPFVVVESDGGLSDLHACSLLGWIVYDSVKIVGARILWRARHGKPCVGLSRVHCPW